MFASLVHWLSTLNDNRYPEPTQYDDPNTTCSNIVIEARKLKAAGDFPPNKLKAGYGPEVVGVLSAMAEATLAHKGFAFARPTHFADNYPEEAPAEDEGAGEPEEEMGEDVADDIDNEDDDDDMYVAAGAGDANGADALEMLESSVDASAWQLEVERLAPQLKLVIHAGQKEWRTHLEQVLKHEDTIESHAAPLSKGLQRIQDEVGEATEKIGGREKHVNEQFDELISEYRRVQEQMAERQEEYGSNSGRVTELTNALADVSNELDHVKSQMDMRGNSMTDTSPLLDMKKALTKVKSEIQEMELRIGAVENTLMRSSVK